MNTKKILEDNIKLVSNMDDYEYLLYCKWIEVNSKSWTQNERRILYEVKNKLWSNNNYKKINPGVVIVKNKKEIDTWNILRMFTSVEPYKKTAGRNIRLLIFDRNNLEYLGIIILSTDYISMDPRDKYIGWNLDDRVKKKRLNHTMKVNVYPSPTIKDYYGCKELLLSIACSDRVINEWNRKYKDRVVGLSYIDSDNKLEYLHNCGSIDYEIPYILPKKIHNILYEWMKTRYPKDLKDDNKFIKNVCKRFQIIQPLRYTKKNVYFCNLFTESKEFLSNGYENLGKQAFDNRFEILLNWWRKKVMSKTQQNNTFTTRLFDDMIGKNWFDTRKEFL